MDVFSKGTPVRASLLVDPVLRENGVMLRYESPLEHVRRFFRTSPAFCGHSSKGTEVGNLVS